MQFKKLLLECSKANINTQPLTNVLSTIYGQSVVARGYQAILVGRLSSDPLVMDRKTLIDYCQWITEEVELVEWISTTCLDGLETKQTEQALSSTYSGA